MISFRSLTSRVWEYSVCSGLKRPTRTASNSVVLFLTVRRIVPQVDLNLLNCISVTSVSKRTAKIVEMLNLFKRVIVNYFIPYWVFTPS